VVTAPLGRPEMKRRAERRSGAHSVVVPDDHLPTVYADESSNPGENLTDPDQPVFAIAAVHLDDAEATAHVHAVLTALPPRHGEPKYSSLAKSPAGRAVLLATLPRLGRGVAWRFVAHKRFMTVAKQVDYLAVELATTTATTCTPTARR
jgi:hypothetical protein